MQNIIIVQRIDRCWNIVMPKLYWYFSSFKNRFSDNGFSWPKVGFEPQAPSPSGTCAFDVMHLTLYDVVCVQSTRVFGREIMSCAGWFLAYCEQKMVALETQKKLVESKIIKVQRQRTKVSWTLSYLIAYWFRSWNVSNIQTNKQTNKQNLLGIQKHNCLLPIC